MWRLRFHKIANNFSSMLRQDTLRMELDALNSKPAMSYSHDHPPSIMVATHRGDFEIGGKILFLDDKRVIAGGSHGRRNVTKDRLAIVLDRAGLAMHEMGGAHHLTTESLTDGLMAETHA